LLPVAPVLEILEAAIRRGERFTDDERRRIRAMATRKHVGLNTADKWFVRLDEPWWLHELLSDPDILGETRGLSDSPRPAKRAA
jgi:hypothetical protein